MAKRKLRWTISQQFRRLSLILISINSITIIYCFISLSKIQTELQEVAHIDVPLIKTSNSIEIAQLEQHILIQQLLDFNKKQEKNKEEFNRIKEEILNKQVKLKQNFKQGIKLSQQGLDNSSKAIFQEIEKNLFILWQDNNLLNQKITNLLEKTELQKPVNENTINQILKQNKILKNQEDILIKTIESLTEEQVRRSRIGQRQSLIINIILGLIVILTNGLLSLLIIKKVNLNFVYFSEQVKKVTEAVQSGKNFQLNQFKLHLSDEFNDLTNNLQQIISYVSLTQEDHDKIQKRLEFLATVDELTGAFNVRKWKEMLNYEIEKTYRSANNLSIILFDIDFFKKINDTYGHQVGDQVLRKLVKIIQKIIRTTDSLYRIGGEEFVILCPNSNYHQAMTLAERIRKSIESTPFEKVNQVTISLGVTQLKKSDNSGEFVKRADQALYQSKQNGRNQVQYK